MLIATRRRELLAHRTATRAREQILIAGWDFDSRILLPPAPGEQPGDAPLRLGDLRAGTITAIAKGKFYGHVAAKLD